MFIDLSQHNFLLCPIPSPRMIITGWRRALQESDLWSLNPRDKSENIALRLAKNWQKQVDKTRLMIE